MTTDYQDELLTDAAKVVATDLYPERCRTLIESLAAELSTILNAVVSDHLITREAADARAGALIADAVKAEQERCAKLVVDLTHSIRLGGVLSVDKETDLVLHPISRCAAAIRALSAIKREDGV